MKKLINESEIKDFLAPFDNQIVPEVVINGIVKLKNATIKMGDQVFSFTGNDYNFYVMFCLIQCIEIEQEEGIEGIKASATIRLDNKLDALFYY